MPRLPLLALAALAAAAAPTAASAQAINYYVATPTTPIKARIVTRGTPWFARGASVVAPRAPETNVKVCAMVAAKAGPLQAFSAGGQAFTDADLATCNAAAAPVVAKAPATAETAAR